MREATRADLPRGKEAQCPICWRIFGGNHAAELHKPYRGRITPDCKDPRMLGLEKRDRRGLAVWVQPTTARLQNAFTSGSQDKAA